MRGRVFFQQQTRPGMAGDFVGVVGFSGSQRCYRIEPTGQGRAPELVEHAVNEVICFGLAGLTGPRPKGARSNFAKPPSPNPNLPTPLNQNGIISLESLHGAKAVMYLDFQGGCTLNWGGVTSDKPDVTT